MCSSIQHLASGTYPHANCSGRLMLGFVKSIYHIFKLILCRGNVANRAQAILYEKCLKTWIIIKVLTVRLFRTRSARRCIKCLESLLAEERGSKRVLRPGNTTLCNDHWHMIC